MHVDLGGIASFRFQKDLVAVFVGEAHDLVFDRGAVSGSFAVDHAAVDRREMEVVSDQLVGGRRGAGEMTAHLLTAGPGSGIKGEKAVGSVTGLLFQLIESDAAPIHTGRGAGLESVGVKAKLLQSFSEAFGSLFPGPAGSHGLMTHPDAATQKGASREHDGLGVVNAAEIGANPCDLGDWPLAGIPAFTATGGVALNVQTGDHRLAQGQVGGVLEQLQHLA